MSTGIVDVMIGRSLKATTVFISGTVLLVGTWFLISFFMLVATEAWLVPWDCVHVSLRPPLGTWERTVNDFFEALPGSILPVVAFMVVGVALFLVGTVRRRRWTLLPGALAVANLGFVLADVLVLDVGYRLAILRLPELRPALDVGYYRTWPGILTTTVLLGVLFAVQCEIAIGAKREGR